MREIILKTIHEENFGGEYIAVDANTNIPYHIWWDGGNMWGNHTIQITWEKVEQLDKKRFSGICESNWQEYI